MLPGTGTGSGPWVVGDGSDPFRSQPLSPVVPTQDRSAGVDLQALVFGSEIPADAQTPPRVFGGQPGRGSNPLGVAASPTKQGPTRLPPGLPLLPVPPEGLGALGSALSEIDLAGRPSGGQGEGAVEINPVTGMAVRGPSGGGTSSAGPTPPALGETVPLAPGGGGAWPMQRVVVHRWELPSRLVPAGGSETRVRDQDRRDGRR